MIYPTIEINDQAIKEVEKRLKGIEQEAPKAISRALNRALTALKAATSKEARKDYTVTAQAIKASLDEVKATPSRLRAGVRSRGKKLGIDKFKVSPKTVQPKRKKQIKITVRKDHSYEIPGAFVAEKNGIKVFKRLGKKRLPVERKYGPSVAQMLGNVRVRLRINNRGQEVYQDRLDREIKYMLERSTS